MLIINADDWGRSAAETDAAVSCYRLGRITSVSAMVFMEDSERAAKLSKDNGLDDVGLHLNFSQRYTASPTGRSANKAHEQIVPFMIRTKYSVLIYRFSLRRHFRDVYQSQVEEFLRLYGKPPSHVDGHQHRHLCANMLVHSIIPGGQIVRRNLSFRRGEKSFVNRVYRQLVDKWLSRRYHLADLFFSLGRSLQENALDDVFGSAKVATVELMTHPVVPAEYAYLTSAEHADRLEQVKTSSFASAQLRATKCAAP